MPAYAGARPGSIEPTVHVGLFYRHRPMTLDNTVLSNATSMPIGVTTTPAHLTGLNPPQLEAVTHFQGPILVLAGAGSGKTRVLTRRVAHLVLDRGVSPDRILAVTFTNKATNEMRHRLGTLLGPGSEGLWVATFHAAALRMLRRNAKQLSYSNDFVVYDEDDSRSALKRIVKELGIDEKRYPVASFARAIDQAKNAYLLPAQYAESVSGYEGNLRAEVYDRYQKVLMQSNAMDFGDLLVNAVLLLERFPGVLGLYRKQLEFILVDEFQDTNPVQYRFVRLLTGERRNLLVVGDDDQSIYAFRGATVRNILDFETDFPSCKVVKLEQNYRSTRHILDGAHGVISRVARRKAKRLWTAAEAGEQIGLFAGSDEEEEARFVATEIRRCSVPHNEIAVFYRTNAQSRALEEALIHFRIPYRIYGGIKFYDRKEVKDVLAYLRLILNEQDDQAFIRIVNNPPRGIGAQTLQAVADTAKEGRSSLYEAAQQVAVRNRGLKKFVELIEELRSTARGAALSSLIADVIERSDYGARLTAAKDPASESRIDNLKELQGLGLGMERSGSEPLEDLRLFLDRVTLTAGNDLPVEESREEVDKAKGRTPPHTVSLMTLHLAKGLEFDLVFLTGLEEGLLPHHRSLSEPGMIDEERRLCYVGMTRARKKLFITRAMERGMFSASGSFGSAGQYRAPSLFVKDIPKECLAPGLEDFLASPLEAPEIQDFGTGIDDGWAPRRRSLSSAPKAERKAPSTQAALVPADSLEGSGKALADPAEIAVGVRVDHPFFGSGTVLEVESIGADPRELRVRIKFDRLADERRLMFKYAKLSVS